MGPIGGEMRGADEAEHGAGGNGPLRQGQTRTLSLDRVAVLVKRPWESQFHLASPTREETSDGPGRDGESPALGTGRTPVPEATLMVHLAVESRGESTWESSQSQQPGLISLLDASWTGGGRERWGECRLRRRQERTGLHAWRSKQAAR